MTIHPNNEVTITNVPAKPNDISVNIHSHIGEAIVPVTSTMQHVPPLPNNILTGACLLPPSHTADSNSSTLDPQRSS